MEKTNLIDAIAKMSNEEYENFYKAIESIWTSTLADLPENKEEIDEKNTNESDYKYSLEQITEENILEFCKNRKSLDKCTHNQKISTSDFYEYANERMEEALNDNILTNVMNKL